jgi:hypothetical protein
MPLDVVWHAASMCVWLCLSWLWEFGIALVWLEQPLARFKALWYYCINCG